MDPVRIAFLTPAFTTDLDGGPASFVNRIPRILFEAGHERAVECQNAGPLTKVEFDGATLRTTVVGSSLVTALVPPELYEKQGVARLRLLDDVTGGSASVDFHISAAPEASS